MRLEIARLRAMISRCMACLFENGARKDLIPWVSTSAPISKKAGNAVVALISGARLSVGINAM